MRPRTLESKTKQLLQYRAQLQRANPPWPEQLLWQALRSRQLGVSFRRQVVLGCYIVDFVAPQAKLVVEVDGRCTNDDVPPMLGATASSLGWAFGCCGSKLGSSSSICPSLFCVSVRHSTKPGNIT